MTMKNHELDGLDEVFITRELKPDAVADYIKNLRDRLATAEVEVTVSRGLDHENCKETQLHLEQQLEKQDRVILELATSYCRVLTTLTERLRERP